MRMRVSLEKLPEVLSALRVNLANILREEAGSECDPKVARRLREVAEMFEVGLSLEDRNEARRKRG